MNSHEGERDGPPRSPPRTSRSTSQGMPASGVPRRPPVHLRVRAGGCAGAGRGPLCQAQLCEPCPLRSRCPVKLDRRAGAYVLKADLVKVNIERRRRAEATVEWRKTVCHKGRDRGNELRAEARPRAWALAGARGPSGAACRLPEGVGVQLQADGPCTPGGDGEHGSAGGRDDTCGRGRMRAAAPQLPPGALSPREVLVPAVLRAAALPAVRQQLRHPVDSSAPDHLRHRQGSSQTGLVTRDIKLARKRIVADAPLLNTVAEVAGPSTTSPPTTVKHPPEEE